MGITAEEIVALGKKGFSQDAIARFAGLTQSNISSRLRAAGLGQRRKGLFVSRSRRDGTIQRLDPVDLWEPYHVAHPTVEKLLSERHFRPASLLRIGGVTR